MQAIDLKMLQRTVPKFERFLEHEGQKWRDERAAKDQFIAEHFSENALNALDDGVLRRLIHMLWAFNGWTNKDWLWEQMLQSGLLNIRKAFRDLLHSDLPIEQRFDQMRKNVRMMGAACISEILAHHDHKRYPIWNSRSRQGLIALGIPENELPKASQIRGKQYAAFCGLTQQVQRVLVKSFPQFKDVFELDFLLYFLSLGEGFRIGPPSEVEEFDHDEVIDQLLELGDGLGFEVQKEFTVSQGCRVDAIWRSRVANLGTVAYAFEVHRRGSRDSAILNLQRVRRDPAIQKVVIVSCKTELDKFKGEIGSLEESFRTAVRYFEVAELLNALEHLGELKRVLNGLGLLQPAAEHAL